MFTSSNGESIRGSSPLKQEIGYIETQKATSGLYAPMRGASWRSTAELLNDPSAINVDGYGKGWLFELNGPLEGTITAGNQTSSSTKAWPQTQRLIKGQLNSTDDE